LSSYGGAIVQAARSNPDGLGSVSEGDVLGGRIDLSGVDRIQDLTAERLLLEAVVRIFLDRRIALREHDQIVFPSKFSRARDVSPEVMTPVVDLKFSGPVEQIYATLVVRLFYSDSFRYKACWRDSADFFDARNNICNIAVSTSDGSSGSLLLSFAPGVSVDSKILFSRFVGDHLKQRATPGTVVRHRIYHCPTCGSIVVDQVAVMERLASGKDWIRCLRCDDMKINLVDEMEQQFNEAWVGRQVERMDVATERNADRALAPDVFLAHNSCDKEAVAQIDRRLRSDGVRTWFDENDIFAGDLWLETVEEALSKAVSIAVFFGRDGVGRFQTIEMQAAIDEAARRGARVIPVLLPTYDRAKPLSPSMRRFAFVEFNSDNDPVALKRLTDGIKRGSAVAEQ
jgi:hypothetical protein